MVSSSYHVRPSRNPPTPPQGSYTGSQALEPLVGVLYTIKKVDDFPNKLQRISGLRGWATERSSVTLHSMLMLPGTRLDNFKVLPNSGQLTSFKNRIEINVTQAGHSLASGLNKRLEGWGSGPLNPRGFSNESARKVGGPLMINRLEQPILK